MIDAKDALEKLIEGNNRFVSNKLEHPNRCEESRIKSLEGQKPFAVIVACSDSRVPVEIIFDVGIGDLFIIRSAGHVLSEAGIASIEYAVKVLGTKLVVVLGHDHCGAVKTAMKDSSHHFSPNIEEMVEQILPAVEKARTIADNDEEILDLAIKNNILNTIKYIEESDPILKTAVETEEIKIIGGNYNIINGKVDFIL